jgi:hypothetical protein
MADLVNILTQLQEEIADSGVTLRLEEDRICIAGPTGSSCLRIVRLYRPSSADIEREAASDVLFVLTAPTQAAIRSVLPYNHILLPEGGCRIVAPGIALIHDSPTTPVEETRQVRLMGRTGILAESMLLGGRTEWSVHGLAADAHVSPALAHRVLARLEKEEIVLHQGEGPRTTRILLDSSALATLWSQEEKTPRPFLRGFLYSASTEALTQKILDACPGSAIGGVLAANLYHPVLTRVNPPIRIWVPGDFSPAALAGVGFQQTDSGANVEFVQAKEDPWQVHINSQGLRRVSQWRAWVEIAHATGRTQELAEALLAGME